MRVSDFPTHRAEQHNECESKSQLPRKVLVTTEFIDFLRSITNNATSKTYVNLTVIFRLSIVSVKLLRYVTPRWMSLYRQIKLCADKNSVCSGEKMKNGMTTYIHKTGHVYCLNQTSRHFHRRKLHFTQNGINPLNS